MDISCLRSIWPFDGTKNEHDVYRGEDCCYTGKYRGVAHSACNLKYSVTKEVPVVFLK